MNPSELESARALKLLGDAIAEAQAIVAKETSSAAPKSATTPAAAVPMDASEFARLTGAAFAKLSTKNQAAIVARLSSSQRVALLDRVADHHQGKAPASAKILAFDPIKGRG